MINCLIFWCQKSRKYDPATSSFSSTWREEETADFWFRHLVAWRPSATAISSQLYKVCSPFTWAEPCYQADWEWNIVFIAHSRNNCQLQATGEYFYLTRIGSSQLRRMGRLRFGTYQLHFSQLSTAYTPLDSFVKSFEIFPMTVTSIW